MTEGSQLSVLLPSKNWLKGMYVKRANSVLLFNIIAIIVEIRNLVETHLSDELNNANINKRPI